MSTNSLKSLIQKAIDNEDMIAIDYRAVDGKVSLNRVIEPFEFKGMGYNEAIVAYDDGDVNEIRSFKLNGITAVNNA